MAPNPVAAVTTNVCSSQPYVQLVQLRGFAPAVTWCQAYAKSPSKPPAFPACPKGNILCAILANLVKSAPNVVSTACSCINSSPSVTIAVPKTSSTRASTSKATEKSVPPPSSSNVVPPASTPPPSTTAPPSTTPMALPSPSSGGVSTTPASTATSVSITPISTPASITPASVTPVETSAAPPATTTTSPPRICKMPDPSDCTSAKAIPEQRIRNPQSYSRYYSGQYFTESDDNAGNAGRPEDAYNNYFDGATPMCDVANLCAGESNRNYRSSFSLYYDCASDWWVCRSYLKIQGDPQAFNLPNSDASAVYGFSLSANLA